MSSEQEAFSPSRLVIRHFRSKAANLVQGTRKVSVDCMTDTEKTQHIIPKDLLQSTAEYSTDLHVDTYTR